MEPSTVSLHNLHTLIFFIATLICLAAQFLIPILRNLDINRERYVYWYGCGAAAIFAFLAVTPNWGTGFGVFLIIIGPAIFYAYMFTPYIRIRKKTYSFGYYEPDDARPVASRDSSYDPSPDAYLTPFGVATARHFWWLMAVGSMACVLLIRIGISENSQPAAAVGISGIATLAVLFGHIDASWDYPVARRQRIQFGLITLVTAGTFTVLYLLAYCVGKRWPWRYKKSGEYILHPRFSKQPPHDSAASGDKRTSN